MGKVLLKYIPPQRPSWHCTVEVVSSTQCLALRSVFESELMVFLQSEHTAVEQELVSWHTYIVARAITCTWYPLYLSPSHLYAAYAVVTPTIGFQA